MKVVHRFILRSFIAPMILSFVIVMFILLMHFLWMRIDAIAGKGLSYAVIMELLSYAMATFIPMALPLATLFASIMTMGNLGEYNELQALKVAGLSLPRIVKPLIILMFFVCLGSFFIANNLTPYAWQQMRSLLSDFQNTKHEMKLQDGVFFNGFEGMSIRVDHHDDNTNKLTNVLIYNTSNRDKMATITADSGYLKMSPDRKYIILTLYDGHMYEENRNNNWFEENTLTHHIFDFQESLIATEGFALDRSDNDAFQNSGQAKNLKELNYSIDSLNHLQDSLVKSFDTKVINEYVYKRYARYKTVDSIEKLDLKHVTVLDKLDTMNLTGLNYVFKEAKKTATDFKLYLDGEIKQVIYPSSQLYIAEHSYHEKLALPFSVMIFFLIGASFGAIVRKGGFGTPIVISVVFFVFYYIISITGENLVKDGALPAYIGTWLSSFILFPLAVFLVYKATNDSAILNADVYIIRFKKIKGFILKFFKQNDKKNNSTKHD